jgi:hypothetical protein
MNEMTHRSFSSTMSCERSTSPSSRPSPPPPPTPGASACACSIPPSHTGKPWCVVMRSTRSTSVTHGSVRKQTGLGTMISAAVSVESLRGGSWRRKKTLLSRSICGRACAAVRARRQQSRACSNHAMLHTWTRHINN